MLDSADKARAHPLNWPGQLSMLHPLAELPEHRLELEARQIRAQAVMLADAEGQMIIRLAPNIEAVGIRRKYPRRG